MALSVVKGSFTWRTTTGDTVISGLTDPKAIILWTTGGQTAAGVVTNQSTRWSQGFATYRGAAVQQAYSSCWATDANTAAIYGSDTDDNACLTRMASDTTRDAVYVLTSMDSTSITLNCTDASAAAVIVHYLVLGGADVSDAEAHLFRYDTATPQDVTLGSGFGNPGDAGDPFLWFFAPAANTAAGGGISGADWHHGLSIVRSATERAALLIGGDDGGGNMNIAIWAKDRALLGFTGTAGTADSEGDIDTSGHPTDGYQLTWPDVPSVARDCAVLALRGTFQAQIGRQATLTSASTQDIAQSFSEELRGCVFFGHSEPGSTSVITTGTSLGNIFIGATDLTTEGASGFGDDDGLGFNNSLLNTSTTQSLQCYGHTGSENGSSLKYAADVAENGSNVRLTYTTGDATAREFAYLFLFDAPAGGAVEGAVDFPITFGSTTNDTSKAYGASATPITFGSTTNAKDIAKSATATPITFGATTNGEVFVAPKESAVDAQFTFGSTTNANSKAYSASATALTFGSTTADSSKAYSATASAYTFGSTTATRRTAKASSATPLVFGSTTNATSKAYSSTTTPIVWDATTHGVTGAAPPQSSLTFPITFGATTSATATSYAASATSIALSTSTGATSKAFGALVYALTWDAVTADTARSYGAALLPIVWGATTNNLSVIVTSFFGGPSPGGGIMLGTPRGGSQAGTPGAGTFGPPSPEQVRT